MQRGELASGDIPDVGRAPVAAAGDQVPAVRTERQAEEPVVARARKVRLLAGMVSLGPGVLAWWLGLWVAAGWLGPWVAAEWV